MKKTVLLGFAIILGSCTSTNFYQVYQTTSDNAKSTDDNVFFEDKNCKIIYDFWSNGVNSGFTIYNKTEDAITLNLDKSFFIINGIVQIPVILTTQFQFKVTT